MSEGNKEKDSRTLEKKGVHPVVKIGSAIATLALAGYAFSEKKGWVPPVIGPTIDKIAQIVSGVGGLPEGCFAEGGIEVPLKKGEYFTLTTSTNKYDVYWDGKSLEGEGWGWYTLDRGEVVFSGSNRTKEGNNYWDWAIIRCGKDKGRDLFMVWRTEELERAVPEPTPTPTLPPVKTIP